MGQQPPYDFYDHHHEGNEKDNEESLLLFGSVFFSLSVQMGMGVIRIECWRTTVSHSACLCKMETAYRVA